MAKSKSSGVYSGLTFLSCFLAVIAGFPRYIYFWENQIYPTAWIIFDISLVFLGIMSLQHFFLRELK